MSTRRPLFYPTLLAALVSCSSNTSAPQDPGGPKVTVEPANRQSLTLGPNGGSLSTTSAAGIQYTLNVPAGALFGEVEIAITPVAAMRELPYSGGLAGAVRLEPSGLQFLAPAELVIQAVAQLTGQQQLIGFSYEGDAEAIDPTVAAQVGDEIRVLITHFSGAGAAVAEPDELDRSACDNLGPDASLLWMLVNCAQDREGFFNLMRSRLQFVLQSIQDATGDDELQLALAEYAKWIGMVYWTERAGVYDASDASTVLASEIEAANLAIRTRLSSAISGVKDDCTPGDLQWLSDFFEYRALAQAIFDEIPLPAEFEDAVLLDGLCATAVIEAIALPEQLPLHQDRSLDADFALDVNGTLVDARFSVAVTDEDNYIQNPFGRSDDQGRYTTVVRRTFPVGALIRVQGTLILPLFDSLLDGLTVGEVPIQVEESILRGGDARVTVDFPTTVLPNVPTPLTILVEQLTVSGYDALRDATVSFEVDGGTANPTQATTSLGGEAQTTITAASNADDVVVTIRVSKDSNALGTGTASALVDGSPQPANFSFLRGGSSIYPVQVEEWCTGQSHPGAQAEGPGDFRIELLGSETCVDSLTDGGSNTAIATRYRFVNSTLRYDTGLQTGIIAIESAATVVAEYSCEGTPYACEWLSYYAESQTASTVSIEFHIDEPVDFEFDGSHSGTPSLFRPQFTLTRIDGNRTDEQMNWNGQSPGSWDGSLVPGDYRVVYHVHDALRATAFDVGGMLATWDTELTLKLTRPAQGAR